MKIYSLNKIFSQSAAFNFNVIDSRNMTIQDVDYINIPFDLKQQSEELQEAVKLLSFDVSEEQIWLYSDTKNITTSIIVNTSNDTISASFSIEVKPPVYSANEKEHILKTADTKEDNGWSEFNHWLEIFEEANRFHANKDDNICEWLDTELTVGEEKDLMWLLVQYLYVTACDGRYLTDEEIAECKAEKELVTV